MELSGWDNIEFNAALLGMTPENLSRAFATLAPYGVKVDGPVIALSKLPDLKVLAKPTALIDDQSVSGSCSILTTATCS